MLGSTPQLPPRVPEGPARPIDCSANGLAWSGGRTGG